ncbi:hypothetical protein P43SY_006136 [Pythium insidiosum]|uniref:FYVE-type domain-containing protein n=1 Tax=Pythium insidiosum TaxID=114742 RepID=A0AAD5L9M0_PYTIN|nr:hypothetical protein P43SY_006136 [Pythium insidiosum]
MSSTASLGHQDGLLVQLGNQKKLFLSNEILYQEAVGALPVLETVLARGVAAPRWRRRFDSDAAEIYETSTGGAAPAGPNSGPVGEVKDYSVVAKLDVKGHLMEVYNALVSDDGPQFEAFMRGLHGKRFKKGSVLHRFEDENASTTALVKTATFSSGSLQKDTEFCFVDYRLRQPEKKSITHVMKSLPKEFHDRLAPKTSVLGGAKDITVCTHAEQVNPYKVRLFFFATCNVDDEGDDVTTKRSTSSSNSSMEKPMQFLIKLARAMSNLESIIVRRRLGFQTFIYLSSKLGARSVKSCKVCEKAKLGARSVKSCKVCEKAFGVIRLENYCQLCGYRTCSGCSESVEVETRPGVLRSHRVCKTCVDSVNNCVFDDDDLDLLGSSPITDVLTTGGPTFAQLQAAHAFSKQRVLTHKTARPKELAQQDAEALKALEYLFSPDAAKQAIALERFGITTQSSQQMQLLERVLRHYISQPLRVAVHDCTYAESDGSREYLLNFEEGLRIADAPPTLMEHVRLDLIERLGLIASKGQTFILADALNALCEIAARVMDCTMAYVSVVSQDMQYAIAHHNMTLLKLPRRETMCAYALTSEHPFIVRNTLHDFRFRDFFCVARSNFGFYASFPVDAPSSVGGGGIVAGLVVVDREPKRAITNRQYARMVMLSRVVTDMLGALSSRSA